MSGPFIQNTLHLLTSPRATCHLEHVSADRAPRHARPAAAAEDVALGALQHGRPRQLEADGALQLGLDVEAVVHTAAEAQ